jgi:MFS family permease
MSFTLLFTLIFLGICAYFGQRFIRLPTNVWLLFFSQPLAMSASSLMVLVSGILGQHLAPTSSLATLPISVLIIGISIAVLPANHLTKRVGRRLSLIWGLSIAVFGALISAAAAFYLSFELLVFGALLLGFSMAFVAQMRFCALESVLDPKDAPKALSLLMVGGIFAAILGPELAVAGKDWIDSPHGFTGSFIGLACLMLLSIGVITQLSPTQIPPKDNELPARDIGHVIKQPIFLVALASGAIGYGLMSYIMTATPLSMHVLQGHSLEETKWVVQSHIIAMYLPSLFSAWLIRKVGLRNLMLIGSLCYLAVVLLAMLGHAVMHYWWVMVLLGIGWNFLFLAGTLLLPYAYQNNERLRVQAINDFGIFVIQATVSLLAGIVLFNMGWIPLVLCGLPFIIVMLLITFYSNWSISISEKLK